MGKLGILRAVFILVTTLAIPTKQKKVPAQIAAMSDCGQILLSFRTWRSF